MGLSRSLAGSGALWRERIESLYLNVRAMTQAAGLEILTVQDGEFLIGDVPALTVRAGHAGVGVMGGIALAEAQSVLLPLGPRHVAALGRGNRLIHLTSHPGRGGQRLAACRGHRLRVPAPGKPAITRGQSGCRSGWISTGRINELVRANPAVRCVSGLHCLGSRARLAVCRVPACRGQRGNASRPGPG